MIQHLIGTLFIISPLIFFTGLPYPHTLPRTILMVIVGCGAFFLQYRRAITSERVSITYVGAAWFLFFIFLLGTTLAHPDSLHGIFSTLERGTGVLTIAACTGIYFVLKNTFTASSGLLERISAYVLIAMSLFGVIQKIFPQFVTTFSEGRIGGTLGNAIFFGMYLTLSILWMGVLWNQKKSWLYIIAMACALIALIMSNASSPLLALGAGIFITCLILAAKKYPRTAWTIGGLSIVCAAGLIIFFHKPLVDRLQTMQTRILNWEMAWSAFLDHPVAGTGWESYRTAVAPHFNPHLAVYGLQETYPDKPHNAYLELLVTTGITGTLLYLIFLGALFVTTYHLFKTGKITRPVFALSIGFLTAYVVQNTTAFETHGTIIPLTLFCAWVGHHKPRGITIAISKSKQQVFIGAAGIAISIAAWIGLIKEMPNMGALHKKDAHALLNALQSPYRIEYLSGLPTTSVSTTEQIIKNFTATTPWDKLTLAKYVSAAALNGGQSTLIPGTQQIVTDSITYNPNRQELYVIAGQFYLAANNLDAATDALKTAISLEPRTAHPHLMYAVVLFVKNDVDGGWQELLRANTSGMRSIPKNIFNLISQKLLATQKTKEFATLEILFPE